MANSGLLKKYQKKRQRASREKCGEWLRRALAGKILGLLRSPSSGFTRIMAGQLSQLWIRNKDTIGIV
jgi:hypothetical protein